jgi:pimeloyl-ACP methyl ester carboxylesterase
MPTITWPGRKDWVVEFILVHGTTQSPAGWDRLARARGARGHGVTVIDLPVDRPEWTVADYAREAAAQAGEPAGRRVAVGHSGGGALLPAIADAAQASAVVWLAAYVPDLAGGASMLEDINAHRDAMFHPDWLGVDPTSSPQQAMRFLFHDCDPPIQQWALGTLRLFNPGPAVYQHTPEPLPPAVARTFILPTGDRTLRPQWMRQAAQQRLGTQPVEVNAGHCPHVSQPETIASILVRA